MSQDKLCLDGCLMSGLYARNLPSKEPYVNAVYVMAGNVNKIMNGSYMYFRKVPQLSLLAFVRLNRCQYDFRGILVSMGTEVYDSVTSSWVPLLPF